MSFASRCCFCKKALVSVMQADAACCAVPAFSHASFISSGAKASAFVRACVASQASSTLFSAVVTLESASRFAVAILLSAMPFFVSAIFLATASKRTCNSVNSSIDFFAELSVKRFAASRFIARKVLALPMAVCEFCMAASNSAINLLASSMGISSDFKKRLLGLGDLGDARLGFAHAVLGLLNDGVDDELLRFLLHRRNSFAQLLLHLLRLGLHLAHFLLRETLRTGLRLKKSAGGLHGDLRLGRGTLYGLRVALLRLLLAAGRLPFCGSRLFFCIGRLPLCIGGCHSFGFNGLRARCLGIGSGFRVIVVQGLDELGKLGDLFLSRCQLRCGLLDHALCREPLLHAAGELLELPKLGLCSAEPRLVLDQLRSDLC
mmetsp:Transcript_313/g.908  ORF Transcript_313/g.908 Transcript_313/m.908 type:complete len:376 (-) Transcript_313:1020-2147(-)